MIDIGNNIKVLLTRFNEHVIMDDIGGELLLYDQTHLCTFEDSEALRVLKDYVFTGVSFDTLPSIISLNVKDLYENSLEYYICNKYIFVKKYEGMDLQDPICVASFVPKNKHWIGTQFFAHFIEKTN